MTESIRKVAVIGGSRIPFCRSNTVYAEKTNLDMLAAALQGLVDRFELGGEQLDEVVAGAVTTHSKDWNLAREALLSTGLSPLTPGITLQQACGTSLQAALGVAAKIAAGQIECGIAAGSDSTSDAPVVFRRKFARRLIRLSQARSLGQRMHTLRGFSFRELAPQPPANAEPRTGLSMGQHCERMVREWEVTREQQDLLAAESHHKAAAAWNDGFFDPLVQSWGGLARDNNIRGDTSPEKLAALRTAFGKGPEATLTAGNSTPLTDGAAAVLLASEEWASRKGLPVQAYLTAGQTAAVDFVRDEGLLMAPTVAVSELLNRTGYALQDFEHYEIHEAFAAQVLCTLKAWESETYCRQRLGREQALGSIDRARMNTRGGSIAVGHPFAATGARILGTLAQILADEGPGKGLISVCTAGGMGVAAILERHG
ncbi:MAG: acetyl-CoA C-acetyltransferase [Xanthomonadales bacterium]|nr:acetyl-CoA C-acetyltransferase [Xanthomonadales bacterium]NIN59445.1 acetyl-CoA C-acetyltransferase [Xanthomonadales bacterium]NIN74819.1 acetyl-CoA C-acetyltransferase [Xanthomonadales bacterium]NIO12646.1 acetyl-CoA C-acetyltransferase [Xanthomonadales bacterium]NIP11838.1 acetyl-CoA C-acetyltransferase [Xanthomonadales bacterium]